MADYADTMPAVTVPTSTVNFKGFSLTLKEQSGKIKCLVVFFTYRYLVSKNLKILKWGVTKGLKFCGHVVADFVIEYV